MSKVLKGEAEEASLYKLKSVHWSSGTLLCVIHLW